MLAGRVIRSSGDQAVSGQRDLTARRQRVTSIRSTRPWRIVTAAARSGFSSHGGSVKAQRAPDNGLSLAGAARSPNERWLPCSMVPLGAIFDHQPGYVLAYLRSARTRGQAGLIAAGHLVYRMRPTPIIVRLWRLVCPSRPDRATLAFCPLTSEPQSTSGIWVCVWCHLTWNAPARENFPPCNWPYWRASKLLRTGGHPHITPSRSGRDPR